MDIADKAAECEADFLAESLARQAQKQHTGKSRTHCAGCGFEIPEARRAAVPGVELCVLCQAYEERGWP